MGEVKLNEMSDAELVSLIGRANAILSDRRRAQNADVQRAVAAASRCPRCGCPGISECRAQSWKSQCDGGARTKTLLASRSLAGRAAIANMEADDQGGERNG